ncbi:MAG: copper amine oxidase N-terminal domain-containing protein [Clostridia bacterium]|nr:copper amine oxidase N-terminal domain-containing protein [Clostridia bacterium]
MKKLISALMVVCLVLGLSVSAFAETINDTGFGISFTLPNSWTDVGDEKTYFFEHNRTNESIVINSYPNEKAYSLEMFGIENIKEICNEVYSDYELSQALSSANDNVYVNVTTNYANGAIEYHNGVEYYKYEKIYTASAADYKPTTFYRYCYIAAQNGAIYFIEYERRDGENNFMDLYNMLDTLSYELGEIIITINNEMIDSDSAPMIIEGRTMVPIRAVAEKLGYKVNWDGANQLVSMIGEDGTSLLFSVGSNVAQKNSEAFSLEVAPFIHNGRTYLPLRAVAEAMSATVDWNGDEKIVEIIK